MTRATRSRRTSTLAISKSREFLPDHVTLAVKGILDGRFSQDFGRGRSPFADKSIVCKSVFPQSWLARLQRVLQEKKVSSLLPGEESYPR
jgi:hypothetical protein